LIAISSGLKRALRLAILAAFLALPLFYHNQYFYQVAILVGLYMVLTMAMHVMLTETGLVMLGQAGFYAVGAYTAALLALRLNMPFGLTFIAGGLAATLLGLVLGLPLLRMSGLFFGLISLSFAEIVRLVCVAWVDVTRGPMGLPRIPRPQILGLQFSTQNEPYFVLMALFVIASYIVVRWLLNTNLGVMLRATRDNPDAAESIGINVRLVRLLSLVVGCFLSGLAGSFYAHFYAYVGPSSFTWNQSLLVLTMSMIGTFAGLPGALLAAAILTIAPELLRPLALYRQVFYGVLLIVLILYGRKLFNVHIPTRLGVRRWRDSRG
jgi:branched-chain amino acid transport system permease protein